MRGKEAAPRSRCEGRWGGQGPCARRLRTQVILLMKDVVQRARGGIRRLEEVGEGSRAGGVQ